MLQSSPEWLILQKGGFADDGIRRLRKNEGFYVFQIGAHTGFEKNDPLAIGMQYILNQTETDDQRQNVHWTFVEPSPPNFKRLEQNLAKHSLCDMKGINAAVVSDTMEDSKKQELVFYSFKDTIDPETGYDSISNKTLPVFITQVSSFSMKPLLFNAGVFRRKGLNMQDYIVKIKVDAKGFSELIKDVMGEDHGRPLIVLIDTEGFDCDIVNGISPTSSYLPKYLIFEIKQCRSKYKETSKNHLESMGYETFETKENAVAIMRNW